MRGKVGSNVGKVGSNVLRARFKVTRGFLSASSSL